MRTLLVLIVGIVIGAFGLYLYQQRAATTGGTAATPASNLSTSARDATDKAVARTRAIAADVSETLGRKMQEWHLTPDDIHADLNKSGEIARQNAARAREKVADVRIVALIKAKFVLDRELDANDIHVESKDGSVTLTGNVASEALIGKAVALSLDTDGVQHVSAKLKVSGQ